MSELNSHDNFNKFKSSTKPWVTTTYIFLIIAMSFGFIVSLVELIGKHGLEWGLYFIIYFIFDISMIKQLISFDYTVEFNQDSFYYEQLTSKGTIYYKNIKNLYLIRSTWDVRGGYSYRIKVELKKGRSLVFSLTYLQSREKEQLKKIFREKTSKKFSHYSLF